MKIKLPVTQKLILLILQGVIHTPSVCRRLLPLNFIRHLTWIYVLNTKKNSSMFALSINAEYVLTARFLGRIKVTIFALRTKWWKKLRYAQNLLLIFTMSLNRVKNNCIKGNTLNNMLKSSKKKRSSCNK